MLLKTYGCVLRNILYHSILPNSRKYLHRTHYDILGLTKNCSNKDIKEAFIKLSKEYHPDKNSRKSAQEHFIKVLEAYNVLNKADSRSRYDWELTCMKGPINDFKKHTHHGHTKYASDYGYDDPSFWNHRNKFRGHYNYRNYYYGEPRSRIPNSLVAATCVLFATISATVQILIIRHSTALRHEVLLQKSIENEKILAELKNEADQNGNELQIKLMEEKLMNNRHPRPT